MLHNQCTPVLSQLPSNGRLLVDFLTFFHLFDMDFNWRYAKGLFARVVEATTHPCNPKQLSTAAVSFQGKASFSYCCLFVCLFSGPATDDKHCFDCLFVVSTINLLGPGRTEENTIKHLTMFKIEKSESGSGLTQ